MASLYIKPCFIFVAIFCWALTYPRKWMLWFSRQEKWGKSRKTRKIDWHVESLRVYVLLYCNTHEYTSIYQPYLETIKTQFIWLLVCKAGAVWSLQVTNDVIILTFDVPHGVRGRCVSSDETRHQCDEGAHDVDGWWRHDCSVRLKQRFKQSSALNGRVYPNVDFNGLKNCHNLQHEYISKHKSTDDINEYQKCLIKIQK